MKSWISFLLPDDEYREEKILYYLSEGSIIPFSNLLRIPIILDYLAFSLVPSLLVNFFGAVLADRFNKKNIIL